MKDGFIKVAAATSEITVADTQKNTVEIEKCIGKAFEGGAKVLCLPEMCVTGYTCGDLFLQRTLLAEAEASAAEIAMVTRGKDMLVFIGLPVSVSGRLYNCAAAIFDGRIIGLIPKVNIPNYSEFYEKRYFIPGSMQSCISEINYAGYTVPFGPKILFSNRLVPQLSVACEICEDLWVPNPPSAQHAMAGATLIVNLSASNDTLTKDEYRRDLVKGQSARLVCGYIYADAGDGESTQDAVYTGHDMIAENGQMLAQSTETSGIIFSEIDVQRIDYDRRRMGTFTDETNSYCKVFWGQRIEETSITRAVPKRPFVNDDDAVREKRCEDILNLQSLGLKKRVEHANVSKLVVGISGGLDSTLAMIVSARTMDMLKRPRTDIIAVTMPCFGTTDHTRSNAELLAERLGAELRIVEITESVKSHFKDIGHDIDDHSVVFENGQARERTQVLMDIANGCGGIVVGTGDLSELALGWATYNGDHMSMYGVNSGVPKTLIRYLVDYTARTCEDEKLSQVLDSIAATPVSPELLPAEDGEISQKTEDLVGPYDLHDFYIYYAVRWGFDPGKIFRLAKIAYSGEFDDGTILKWLKTFYRRFFNQQFKRSCLPDGPKVGTITLSPRSDWRMPSDASCAIWQKQLERLN